MRYDTACMGRRVANATFFASHDTDKIESASYGLDITELVNDESINAKDFIIKFVEKLRFEIEDRVDRMSGKIISKD